VQKEGCRDHDAGLARAEFPSAGRFPREIGNNPAALRDPFIQSGEKEKQPVYQTDSPSWASS